MKHGKIDIWGSQSWTRADGHAYYSATESEGSWQAALGRITQTDQNRSVRLMGHVSAGKISPRTVASFHLVVSLELTTCPTPHTQRVMRDLLDDPMVVAGAGLLVIAGGCAIVFCIARRFRDYTDEDQQDAQQLLANLKEMHLRGDITDEEFRVITVANQPHTEADNSKSSQPVTSDCETTHPGAESNNDPDEPTHP